MNSRRAINADPATEAPRTSSAVGLRVRYLGGRVVLQGVRPATGNDFPKSRTRDLAVELLPVV